MISLKSYLRDLDGKTETAYRRIIGLLLQGIELHAVEGDKADYERFRGDMHQFERTLSPETPVSELLVIAGGAVRTMEDYNRRTSKFVWRQNAELQHMVSMLTQAIINIGNGSETSACRLQDIEKALERTQQVEDLQALKLRLGECLEAVREEAVRQKAEGKSALESLRQELENSREVLNSFSLGQDLDSATGLPGKAEAEKAIQSALVSPKGKFVVVAVIRRIQAINARFGYAVGDRVLGAFAEHFRRSLSSLDKVYRWQGPALVALLERSAKLEQVRAEVRPFADIKLEKTIEVGLRTVMIPVSASWSVFPLMPPVDAFLKKLETFTAAQAPRDHV